MKLYWKIFFMTMFISMLCVSLSGYIIIDSGFSSQIVAEKESAETYSEIVFYSLANRLKYVTGEVQSADELIADMVQNVSIGGAERKIDFGIVDKEGNTVSTSLGIELDKEMLKSLAENRAGMMLKEKDGKVYVQTMRPVEIKGSTFYIETVSDITRIFENQRGQYGIMIQVMAIMMVLAGLMTFIFSRLLLVPVRNLTEITRHMAHGNMSERAVIKGQDEISLLSENFNRMADRLEEKMDELQEEAERKELFVGAFSHELKTPMTSIIGYADLMRQKKLSEEQRKMCADYIFTEGKRLERLSMRLLEMIVAKRRQLDIENCHIGKVVAEACETIAPRLANTVLTADICNAEVPMEAGLMKTVFINLLDNARKATADGGIITVSGKMQGENYVVTVSDTGRGMDKAELARITAPFYTTGGKKGGAGLGLAICSEIVAAHGFELAFESEPGVGTNAGIIMKGGRQNEAETDGFRAVYTADSGGNMAFARDGAAE